MGQVITRLLSLLGIKGEDGSSIATTSNPFPVQEARIPEVDPDNTTTTPLGADAKYTGAWKPWGGFLGLEFSVHTDVTGGLADDGVRAVVIEISADGGSTIDRNIGIDITASDATLGGYQFQIGLQGTHYRVTYQNGSTPQTEFRLTTTKLTQLPVKGVGLEDTLTDRSLAVIGRHIIVAKDNASGQYFNVLTTPFSDAIPEPAHSLDVGAYTLGYDEDTDTWNRIRSRQPVDNMTNPGKALNMAGFTMFWNPSGSPANRWNRAIARAPADAMSNTQHSLLSLSRLQAYNGTSWDRLRGDTTNGLDVDVTRSALPTGAATETTLNSIKTAVEIIDDWDESDRAAVNTIVGQIGVAAGSGVIDATTQRVTLATDDSLHTTIDDTSKFGATAAAPGTQSVAGTATQIVASASTRKVAIIRNTDSLNTLYLGYSSAITTANAPVALGPGDSWKEEISTTAIYGITSGASVTAAFQEVTS